MEPFYFKKMTIGNDNIIRFNRLQADVMKNTNAASRVDLWSHLHDFEYDEGRGLYIPLGQDVYTNNRIQAEFGMVPCPPAGGLERAFPYKFFGNPLLIPQQEAVNAKPVHRLTNAGFIFVTHEIDSETVDQFNEIGNWFAGNRADRTIFNQVHLALKGYRDYRGYCVVYSGRRSYHIHFRFDTTHLANAPYDECVEQRLSHFREKAVLMHRACGNAWDATEQAINLLNPPIAGDPKMRSAIQWRRAPFAIRQIDNDKAIFGLEVGDCVPQLVIRESMSSRAYAGSDAYLIDVGISASQRIGRPRNRDRSSASGSAIASPLTNYEAIVEAIRTYLSETWQTPYPRLEAIDRDQNHFVLYFANGPTDRTPSTYVRGEYRCLDLQGKHGFGDRTFWLPDDFSANEIVEFYSRFHGVKPVEIVFNSHQSKEQLKKDGRNRDQTVIIRSMNCLFDELSGKNNLLVTGAPGSGKSTAVLKFVGSYFPDEFKWERERRKLRVILFCSTSMEQAQKKLDEFNILNGGKGQGVLYESFMTVYRRNCKDAGIESIEDQFDKQSPNEVWRLIETQQREIAHALAERRQEMWVNVNRDKVVFVFTSIAMLYNWDFADKTKALNHPDFDSLFDDDETNALAENYRIVTCILDDFNTHDLIVQITSIVLDKVDALQSKHANWRNYPKNQRRSVFATHGFSLGSKSFEEFDSMLRMNLARFERIAVDFGAIPYGCDNSEAGMYRAMNGFEYGIAVRDWLQRINCPKLFLTTEAVMAKIVKAVVDEHRLIECHLTPGAGIHPVHVPIVFDNRARSEDRDQLANEIICENHNGIVIGNGLKVKARTTNFTIMKGVNEYKDNDIYIIMTMLPNDHYATLNTLGQFIDETNIIALHYRDLVSQAIGRNTGYRDSGNDREAVIIAGARLIKAGYFHNGDAGSDDPGVVREFITYPCPDKPWLGQSSGSASDDTDMEEHCPGVPGEASTSFANSSRQIVGAADSR